MDKKVILITVICSIVLFAGIFTLCGIAASKNNNSKGNVKNSEYGGVQSNVGGNTSKDENVSNEIENDAKATILTKDGETVRMSAAELINTFDENEARFYKQYGGAKITFTGTISGIHIDALVKVKADALTAHQTKIAFEEGWSLAISADNTAIDVADFSKGEQVEVTTGILLVASDTGSNSFNEMNSEKRVVWLVGNDSFNREAHHNDITTKITKK